MTVAELEDAVQAGNVVCLRQGDAVYTLTFKGTSPMFVCVHSTTIRRLAYFTSDQLWHYFAYTMQEKLVSGTNIKTVGGQSILGSGNISLPTLRTINGEQLTDSSLGDINIHDGFYFPNAVQDYDGNWYGAVVIGEQVWLGENLRTTKYADGTAVSGYYNDEQSQLPLKCRGLLYDKDAVMNGEAASSSEPSGVQGISPDGWHIPSISEYNKLCNYLSKNKRHMSDKSNPYSNAKSVSSTVGWTESNVDYSVGNEQDKNNSTGFNAYPANMYIGSGSIGYGAFSYFHVSNDDSVDPENYLQSYYLSYYGISFSSNRINNGLSYCLSVRCVSDLTPLQFRDWYINQYGSLQHQVASTESGLQPTLVSGTNIKTINGNSVLGSGNLDITTPLYDNGTRIMIDSDGLHTVDLTDHSVTVINFADGVKTVQINFTLNAIGDREVVLKRARDSSNISFSVNELETNLSNKLLTCNSSTTINSNSPRMFTVKCRKIDSDVYLLANSGITSYTSFGNSNDATWTPPSE